MKPGKLTENTFARAFILYFACFLLLLEFPFLHSIPGGGKSEADTQNSKFVHRHSSEDTQENVRHFHSYAISVNRLCFLCAFNSSLFSNNDGGLQDNYHDNTSYLVNPGNDLDYSAILNRFPSLRAPPSV